MMIRGKLKQNNIDIETSSQNSYVIDKFEAFGNSVL